MVQARIGLRCSLSRVYQQRPELIFEGGRNAVVGARCPIAYPVSPTWRVGILATGVEMSLDTARKSACATSEFRSVRDPRGGFQSG